MPQGEVTFDARQVVKMLDRLNGVEMKNAAVSALRKGANILAKKTTSNFRSKIKINAKRTEIIKRGNGKNIKKIRRIATVKVDKKKLAAKVHIMSDFRLKFFEMGTKERRTKGYRITGAYYKGRRKYLRRKGKGRRTGRIKPGWYFRSAMNETEHAVFASIESNLSKAILRIANKK